jgi:ectoine hydroxylase-related dioxygenase (phytanoyl-CoA dioxygenase family)
MIGAPLHRALDQQGFAILPSVFSPQRVACLVAALERALPDAGKPVLRSRGQVYGFRNLIDVWPPALTVAQEAAVREVVEAMLGQGFGLVRSIFFDKPPGRTWSLPWHRDRTIAVREARCAAREFERPTVKAGIPHVGAPTWLLRRMLTARVALDDVGDDNGPLLVIPGSHVDDAGRMPSAQELNTRARAVHMRTGDALFIRPLVLHRSGPSKAGTARHRRTLHFEFAAALALPGGLEWHRFLRHPPERQARENEPIAPTS